MFFIFALQLLSETFYFRILVSCWCFTDFLLLGCNYLFVTRGFKLGDFFVEGFYLLHVVSIPADVIIQLLALVADRLL